MEKQKEYIIKTTFIYLMLGIYTFGLIKPVMPLVKDVIAHAFFEDSHVAAVHYENGRYHIHLELKEQVATNDTKTPIESAFETVSSHIQSERLKSDGYFQNEIEVNTPYLIVSIELFSYPPFTPPKA